MIDGVPSSRRTARTRRAAAATPSGVSPLTRRPTSKPAICAGEASPRITTPKTAAASDSLSDCRLARATSACCRGGAEGVAASGMERGQGCQSYPEKRAFVKQGQRVAPLDAPSRFLYLSRVTSRPFLAVVHYDGAQFVGWQRQAKGRTVQAEFEEVLARLLGHRTTATGAGRTDTGVHALGQAVGFATDDRWAGDVSGLKRALNALLPRDVWVERVHAMRPGFHARTSAMARRYRYVIGTDEACRSPFRRPYEWALGSGRPLDLGVLSRAAEALQGDHEFRGLAAAAGGDAAAAAAKPGYRCRGGLAERAPRADGTGVTFTIEADRFLHRMVRFLVGAMVDIALGRRPPSDFPRLLTAGDNQAASPPAPPQGLYLVAVRYPPHLYAGADS